jgi:hypothetical protein
MVLMSWPCAESAKGQARQHAAARDQHGAGAALAMVAAFLAAGETDMFAQGVEHRGAGIDPERFVLAINAQRHVDGQRGVLRQRSGASCGYGCRGGQRNHRIAGPPPLTSAD